MKSRPNPEPILWLSDSRGQFIPRDFATSFKDRDKDVSGVTADDWATLEKGPDEPDYWETWDDVINAAVVTCDGIAYRLETAGDLWLIPEGMEWSEETDWWYWPQPV